jgi:iron complex transport system substrate-binding protein
VEEVIESVRRLGAVLGARERGDALALELHARLEQIRRRVNALPPRRVFFVVWPAPLISIGKNTFLADALRWAGAESVVETAQDWPRLSIEEVLLQQPEYLVFSSMHLEEASRTIESLRERAGWRSLEAIREGRIAVVSDAVNRPSPRLVDVIEQLARQLHPEAFAPENEKPGGEKRNSKFETRNSLQPRRLPSAHQRVSNSEFRVSISPPGFLPTLSPEASRCVR